MEETQLERCPLHQCWQVGAKRTDGGASPGAERLSHMHGDSQLLSVAIWERDPQRQLRLSLSSIKFYLSSPQGDTSVFFKALFFEPWATKLQREGEMLKGKKRSPFRS